MGDFEPPPPLLAKPTETPAILSHLIQVLDNMTDRRPMHLSYSCIEPESIKPVDEK